MKRLKFLLKIFAVLAGLVILSLIGSEMAVSMTASEDLYDSVESIPSNRVGILLGTSKRVSSGNQNLYYNYRIDAAVKLFEAGKIEYILVSGDNATRYYDEPTTMKKDLVARGVPSEKIFLDYAGFRTLDSIVRSKAVFGQEKITVISQPFHNERALFIAANKDIDAIAFNAQDVSAQYGMKVRVREQLARVKVMWDLLVGVEPKFYGDPVVIQ